MQTYRIVLFGAGNVAHHLGKALQENGNRIIQIIGRTNKSTANLAANLNCNFSINYNDISENADIYIIATNDTSISDILSKINFENKLVIHTSGSTAIDVFSKIPNHGVLYPLQTFSINRAIYFSNIPLFIEANNLKSRQTIENMARQLSHKVEYANSEKRKTLHLSAVFACNFTNHMLVISQLLLEKEELNFDYLKPLITETIKKALDNEPLNSQTGPAIRNDESIIEKHIELLSNNIDYQKMYSFVSESINKLHQK